MGQNNNLTKVCHDFWYVCVCANFACLRNFHVGKSCPVVCALMLSFLCPTHSFVLSHLRVIPGGFVPGCAQKSLLVKLGGPYGMPGIESGLAVCKANALPTVSSL